MGGIIGGLFIAWVFSWFNIDHMIIEGLYELFKLQIGIPGYYVLFACLGFITELFTRHK